MIKHFADNNPLVLVLIPIIVSIHFILDYYFPAFGELVQGQDNLLGLDFTVIPSLYSKLLAFLFICGNAFLINYIYNSIEFYEKLNFLPSILYLLILFIFPISLYFNEHLVAHTLVTLSLKNLFSIKQNEDARNSAFLSGFFIGLAVLFSPIYLIFIINIGFALLTIRSFIVKEHLLPYLGFLFPLMWLPLLHPEVFQQKHFLHTTILLPPSYHLLGILALTIISLLVIFPHKKILEKRSKSSIRFKKINTIALFSFIFALGISLLLFGTIGSYFYLITCVVILPYILTYTYLNLRIKWFAYTLFYSLIAINIIKFLL